MPDPDHDRLCRRVAAAAGDRLPGAVVASLSRLPGGLSSDTYAAELRHDAGRSDVVLKVAPPGLAPVHNRDVLRQARLLDALADVPGFPVPTVLFVDPGDPPGTPPLFGMTRADGQAYEPRIDVTDRPPAPGVAAERMRGAARALAALHAVDPAGRGLDDTVITPEQECGRWGRLFTTIDADICAGHDDLARRLHERMPTARPARVHHGDYRVANMLFAGTALTAVIDWEIWSLGDPRFDLAWLAMHTAPEFAFHARRPAADVAAGSALPDADGIVAEYLDADGADRVAGTDLDWFVAASQYKGASIVAALVKRERRRREPDPQVMTAGSHLDRLLDAGHRALDRWR